MPSITVLIHAPVAFLAASLGNITPFQRSPGVRQLRIPFNPKPSILRTSYGPVDGIRVLATGQDAIGQSVQSWFGQ